MGSGPAKERMRDATAPVYFDCSRAPPIGNWLPTACPMTVKYAVSLSTRQTRAFSSLAPRMDHIAVPMVATLGTAGLF